MHSAVLSVIFLPCSFHYSGANAVKSQIPKVALLLLHRVFPDSLQPPPSLPHDSLCKNMHVKIHQAPPRSVYMQNLYCFCAFLFILLEQEALGGLLNQDVLTNVLTDCVIYIVCGRAYSHSELFLVTMFKKCGHLYKPSSHESAGNQIDCST